MTITDKINNLNLRLGVTILMILQLGFTDLFVITSGPRTLKGLTYSMMFELVSLQNTFLSILGTTFWVIAWISMIVMNFLMSAISVLTVCLVLTTGPFTGIQCVLNVSRSLVLKKTGRSFVRFVASLGNAFEILVLMNV